MGQTSLRLPDKLEEEVESYLSYGDSKSEWIRHAIKIRLQCDPMLDELYESYQNEERIEFVEAAVREKIEQTKSEQGQVDR